MSLLEFSLRNRNMMLEGKVLKSSKYPYSGAFFKKNCEKISKKFGSNKKMPTFAIPNNKAVVVKW